MYLSVVTGQRRSASGGAALPWARPACLALLLPLLATAALAAPEPPAPGVQSPAPLFYEPNAGQYETRAPYLLRAGEYAAEFHAGHMLLHRGALQLRVTFEGASAEARPQGAVEMGAAVNYFIGGARETWATRVTPFESVVYRGLYPGIDLKFSSAAGQMKSEYRVAPGADPGRILLHYAGAKQVRVTPQGELAVETEAGAWVEHAPLLWQETPRGKRGVGGRFRVTGDGRVGFAIAAAEYDRTLPLVIDPLLVFATLLGGSGISSAQAVAVDGVGEAYIAGYTDALDFPRLGALRRTGSGVDAIVLKYSPLLNALVYAAYIGGAGDDRAFGIAVDAGGSAAVTGWTGSTDFPIANAAQPFLKGGRDAFLLKLSPFGDQLLFSTYYGGAGIDAANAVALDGAGAAYIAGDTTSTNLPVPGGRQTLSGGQTDAFVAKFSAAGALVWGTYHGGAGNDTARAIALTGGNAVAVGGASTSPNFPAVKAVQTALRGTQDAFVSLFTATGDSLLFSTLIGGTSTDITPEQVNAIAVDAAGRLVAAGGAPSADFPVVNAVQPASNGGGQEAFLLRIDPVAGALLNSTYFGGTGRDVFQALRIDDQGRIYAAGSTSSPNLAVVDALQTTYGGLTDGLLVRLEADWLSFGWVSYSGGAAGDAINGLALSPDGSLFAVGQSGSSNFTTLNPVATPPAGAVHMSVVQVNVGDGPQAVSVAPREASGTQQTFTFVYSHPRGAAQISGMQLLINGSFNAARGCMVSLARGTGFAALAGDDAATWTGFRLGGPDLAGNSQCIINPAAASVTESGLTITLVLPIVFRPAFTGAKQIYMSVWDVNGKATLFLQRGAYLVAGSAQPKVQSFTPNDTLVREQLFRFTYSDADGGNDIAGLHILINAQQDNQAACYLQHVVGSGVVSLANDTTTGWTPVRLLSADTAANSQCVVSGTDSSSETGANTYTLSVRIQFKPTFAGVRKVYSNVWDRSNVASGWSQVGVLTVNQPPSVTGLSPANGAGSGARLTFSLADPNGGGDIMGVYIIINFIPSGANSCYLFYNGWNNSVYLADDQAAAFAQVRLGTGDTAQNTQCMVSGAASVATVSGNTLSLALDLTFKPVYNGQRNVFVIAYDLNASWSGVYQVGTYTVAGTNHAPAAVSVSPNTGSGLTRTFRFTYQDDDGAGDVAAGMALINSTLDPANACLLYFAPLLQGVSLANDAANAWSANVRFGTAESASNSHCTVNGAGSAMTASGNTVTADVAVTFNAGWTGTKQIHMLVWDWRSVSSGWQYRGLWTVP